MFARTPARDARGAALCAPDPLVMVHLVCVSVAVSWLVGVQLFDARTIVQRDVWFQADPENFLAYRFNENTLLRHPNVGLLVGMPLTMLRQVLGLFDIGTSTPRDMQHWLMLLVAPAASALRTLAAYRSLRLLTGTVSLAALLTLLDVAAFATVALAAVPESFTLTAAVLALLYWLFLSDVARRRIRWTAWLAAGAAAAGVTVTNLAPFAVLLGATLLAVGVRLPRVLLWSFLSILAVSALTAMLAGIGAVSGGRPLTDLMDSGTRRFFRATPTRADAAELALAMAHTFVAPLAQPMPGAEPPSTNPDYGFQLLLPTTVPATVLGWSRALFTMLLLAAGASGYLRRRETAPWLLPAVAILLTNVVLHLFYGHHYFLYSLHWSFSMIWIVAGVAFLPGRARRGAIAALAAFVAVTAVNSVVITKRLIDMLQAT